MGYMTPKSLILTLVVFLGLVAAAVFFFIRPGEDITPPPAPVATSTETATITDDGQYHDITANYPRTVTLHADASASAKASAEAVIEAWAKETVQTFKTNANLDSLTPEDIRIQGLDQGRKYALDVKYEEYEGPATVSYLFTIYEDTLGAHPNAYLTSFTFDATTGKELRIADLFENPTYLETLSRISREMLIPQIAKATEVPVDEMDTSYIESGTTPEQDNFQVFYLTSTDLVIVFPPYQVGPWVLGTQSVTIPRAELENGLKAAYR